jgi:2-polyprenyl-6-methoxyphenol hydroxylase-like FAD-dependent oxidoreductase
MSKLKDNIPIIWNKKLDSINFENNNNILLKFNDSTKIISNFVIGCDGIYSNVRKVFIDKPLNYLNVFF